MSEAETGSLDGVPYEVWDLSETQINGFAPGFYYAAGEQPEESTEGTVLEGPYASHEAAAAAAHKFILDALTDEEGASEVPEHFTVVPIDYAAKCKRRRDDGPTPCLCCLAECVG